MNKDELYRMYREYANKLLDEFDDGVGGSGMYWNAMLVLQDRLNRFICKVNGIDCNKISRIQIVSAMLDELGEMLKEFKPVWAWWIKKGEKTNEEKVLEEFVDFVHFYLTYLISFYKEDELMDEGDEFYIELGKRKDGIFAPIFSIIKMMWLVAEYGNTGAISVVDLEETMGEFMETMGWDDRKVFEKYVEKSFENYLRQVGDGRYGKVPWEVLEAYAKGAWK